MYLVIFARRKKGEDMTTVNDFRQSRLYKLAFTKLIMDKKVKYHYTSNTFRIVEEDFLKNILEGLLILREANKKQIKI